MLTNPFKPIQPERWCQLKLTGQSSLTPSQCHQLFEDLEYCQFEYAFFHRQRLPSLKITVHASIHLRCQRCDELFRHDTKTTSKLALMPKASQESEQYAEESGLELFVVARNTCIADVIKEEISLTIPFVPKCQPNCQSEINLLNTISENNQAKPQVKPFADLKQRLKELKSDDRQLPQK